ncbi:hypothetical protein HQ576_11105 [bacterium]|nr:hypothetical protein [bacterium]
MEVVRRILLLAGILSGLWFYLVPTPVLVRVSLEDFAKRQAKQPAWRGDRDLPLDAFIAKQTEDRLVAVAGAEWDALVDAAARVAAAAETLGPVDEAWRPRVGRDYSRRFLYFYPHEKPVATLMDKFDRFTYITVGSGAATRYLGVNRQDPEMLQGSAPLAMLYPLRRHSGLALLIALLAYFLLPWPRHTDHMVYYGRLRGSYLADLVGLMLLVPFFAAPLLIVPTLASSGRVLDTESGFIYMTLIFWALGIFGLAILGVAAWYSRLRIVILDDGLRRETLLGSQTCRFEEIAGLHLGSTQAPKALVKAAWLVSLFNWRALGTALIMSGRSDGVLEVECRDGRRFQLVTTALRNIGALVEALDRAHVPVDEAVRRLAADS